MRWGNDYARDDIRLIYSSCAEEHSDAAIQRCVLRAGSWIASLRSQ